MPLVAVTVMVMLPPAPVGGVPLSTPEDDKVNQLGKVVVVLKVGAGKPLALNWKLPEDPAVKLVEVALVNTSASLILKLKLWETGEPTPLLTVTLIE